MDWLLWSLFNSDRAHESPEWKQEIDSYVASVERLSGKRLQLGRNEGTKCMRVTLDPVVMVHRPLLWYGVSKLAI